MKARRTPRPDACAWALALLLSATGCTICPDPFDYSGPVPNGSAPQNDFRARSGGIAPIGGVSRPWPPVVQADPEVDDAARTAATTVEVPATDGHEAEAPAAEAATAIEAVAAEEESPETMATRDDDVPVTVEPSLEAILPPVAPQRHEILPPLRETPGWHPRR